MAVKYDQDSVQVNLESGEVVCGSQAIVALPLGALGARLALAMRVTVAETVSFRVDNAVTELRRVSSESISCGLFFKCGGVLRGPQAVVCSV